MGDMDFSALFQQRPSYDDYFSGYRYQAPDRNFFFNMEDPEVQRYQELAGKPPASQGFIEDYLSRRPDLSDYQPSLGRKLGALILGTAAGYRNPALGYETAHKVRMDPYNTAYSDWAGEGQGLTARAKALDEAQNRELSALKFGLTERAKAAQQARLAAEAKQRLGNTYASGATRSDLGELGLILRDQAQRDRQAQIEWNNRFREGQEANDERWRGVLEGIYGRREDRLGTERTPRVSNEPAEVLKQTQAAQNLILQELGQQPVWQPIIQHMRAAVAEGQHPIEAMDSAPVDPMILRTFKALFSSRVDDLMRARR